MISQGKSLFIHVIVNKHITVCKNILPQNRESTLAARILMVLSASIVFTLGVVHLVYTRSLTGNEFRRYLEP
jgi:hypothetical protein